MNTVNQNLSEISAEMLVNYLYPEQAERWIPYNQGTFYRNYNLDVLGYDEQADEIQLARDGFCRLLPEGLLYAGDNMRDSNNQADFEKQDNRKRLLEDMFRPFDAFEFRRKLQIERQISTLLDGKIEYILNTYFNIYSDKLPNSYVKELSMLLPFVHSMRGDLMLIRNLLAALFKCEVSLYKGRYSQTDNTRSWIPQVTYELHIANLTTETYAQLQQDIAPVQNFVEEWLMPLEAHCRLEVKWHHDKGVTGSMLLNYDAKLS